MVKVKVDEGRDAHEALVDVAADMLALSGLLPVGCEGRAAEEEGFDLRFAVPGGGLVLVEVVEGADVPAGMRARATAECRQLVGPCCPDVRYDVYAFEALGDGVYVLRRFGGVAGERF